MVIKHQPLSPALPQLVGTVCVCCTMPASVNHRQHNPKSTVQHGSSSHVAWESSSKGQHTLATLHLVTDDVKTLTEMFSMMLSSEAAAFHSHCQTLSWHCLATGQVSCCCCCWCSYHYQQKQALMMVNWSWTSSSSIRKTKQKHFHRWPNSSWRVTIVKEWAQHSLQLLTAQTINKWKSAKYKVPR